MKSKKISAVVLLALAVAAPSAAEAAVRAKLAKAMAGDADYETDGGYTTEGDYTPLAMNLAFIGETGGYFDIGYSSSSDDALSSFGTDMTYERTDLALTFGGVSKGIGGYIGLRKGEGVYSWSSFERTLSSTGLVFGLSGQFKPAPKHTIAITGGLGLLEGELENTSSGTQQDADWTTGFSWGLAYSFQAAEKVAIGLEHKAQQYEFEFWGDGVYTVDAEVTESLSNTSLFVSFVF